DHRGATMPPRDRRAIHLEVLAHHAVPAEALDRARATARAIHGGSARDRTGHLVDVANEESGHALVDHLRRRAAREGDHRSAAEHRLDHDEAERLFPADRKERRARAPEMLVLARAGRLAHPGHAGLPQARRDFARVIGLALPFVRPAREPYGDSGAA